MNRYKTVVIPAYDDFIDTVSSKVDSESDINTIGSSAYDDITTLVGVLIAKAYKAGYADRDDKHQQKAKLLKALQEVGGNK